MKGPPVLALLALLPTVSTAATLHPAVEPAPVPERRGLSRLLAAASLPPASPGPGSLRLSLADSPPAEVRFVAAAPLDAVVGVSHAVSGTAVLDPEAPGSAQARVAVDLGSFDTGIDLRNEDLRDQFLEADRYKQAVLTVKRLERLSAPSLVPGRDLEADAVATFSLHGVEREVRVPVTLGLEASGGRTLVTVRGQWTVNIGHYGMHRPERLFLKVGEVVQIRFRATLATVPPAEAAPPPAVAAASGREPAAPAPAHHPVTKRPVVFVPVARLPPAGPPPKKSPPFRFRFDSSEGRGERMFRDASIGGAGNALSCASCHSTVDERSGLVQDGTVKPDRTLFGSARRPSLWQGMARTVGEGASICAKWFMLKPDGLDRSREVDLAAYLAKLGHDPAPALDYRVLALTRRSALDHPLRGDPRRGEALERKFCGGCHGERAPRPPLTPGLYEADDLVRRVRWLDGTDARQMPPIYVDRLPDSELRDIVTYLVGDASERVFERRGRPRPEPRASPARERAPAGPGGRPARTAQGPRAPLHAVHPSPGRGSRVGTPGAPRATPAPRP